MDHPSPSWGKTCSRFSDEDHHREAKLGKVLEVLQSPRFRGSSEEPIIGSGRREEQHPVEEHHLEEPDQEARRLPPGKTTETLLVGVCLWWKRWLV